MIKLKILHWERPSTKVVIVIFSALLVLSGYFIISSYKNYLKSARESTMKNLQSISNTLSLQIKPSDVQYLDSLLLKGKTKDFVRNDPVHNKVQNILTEAFIINQLKDTIQIIYHNDNDDKFYYITNSGTDIFFGDIYDSPDGFHTTFQNGGTLGPYNDVYGTWFTSLSLLKNDKNQTVGAIEVDLKFDAFIKMANAILYRSLLASIIIFIITSVVLLRYVRIVMVTEESTRKIIEEKNNDIIQSINYALRIQTAILPSEELIQKYLPDSFILYKPKDIVAGDFYWLEQVDDIVLIAACDCTGHGVPGAMVSVICHNALNRAVREYGLTKPGDILDKTADIVVENFSRSEKEIRDGMDISLCSISLNHGSETNDHKVKIEWAGANNPLWIVRSSMDSANPAGLFEETKADKQPIGKNEERKPFTNHTYTLEKGDIIYLFTDGYADQFSGDPEQKKLTKKRFRELILSLQNKTIEEQGRSLGKFIVDYRKDTEQVDDILVIGVKV